MKHFKKIISILLSFSVVLSVGVLNVSGAQQSSEPQNFSEYREMLEREGYPALSTKQFVNIVRAVNSFVDFITGKEDTTEEHFNFVADEMLVEICSDIAERSGLDILLLIQSLPETNQYAEFVVETFDIDTAALRDEIYAMRDEYYAEGNNAAGGLLHFLGVYMSIIDECKAYCVSTPEYGENCYEIHLKITMRDGTSDDVGTGIIINTATGQITGINDDGMAGIGYSFSIPELLIYAPVHVWMRDFGFCLAYDLFCYATPFFFYNTRRIKFEYDGLDWMIQMWKGNYLVSNGAEVGIYNREPGKIGTYYDCATDEQMLEMSMQLYHGEDLLFEREPMKHWWMTGFRLSSRLYPAETMTLRCSIVVKDAEMLSAFCKAIDNHYRNDITYSVDGLTVNVTW